MKLQLSTIRVLLALILALPLLTACESEEDRTLAEAQACINTATDLTVDACVAKVAGMTSEDAFLIRCSSHFIAQGFNENRLASAFQDIKKSSSTLGATPTTVALSFMIFNEQKSGHTVAESKSDCDRSGAASLSRVLSLVEVATKFADAANLADGSIMPGNTAAIEGFISNYVANASANQGIPAAQAEANLGNLAIGIREDFCVNSSPFSGTDICTKMNTAFNTGGGDPQTIGQQIIALLQ